MRRATGSTGQSGFTLLELMVVVAIIALVTQVAMFNMGALIPSAVLDSEAKRFMAHVDYIRSEARLNGKSYALQLDLTNQRWRIVLPPEDKLVSISTTAEIQENVPLEWSPIDPRVKIDGVAQPGTPPVRNGLVSLVFDENGLTGDQAVFFRLRDEEQKLVWTVQIRGLTGQSTLIVNRDNRPMPLDDTIEGQF